MGPPVRIALLAAGLLLGAAAPGTVATGPAAFGDWSADAPGVLRRITPADLPPPDPAASAATAPEIVPRPPGLLPQVPPGFAVSLWQQGLSMPRTLRRAPDGSIFLAESGAGRVLRLLPDGSRTVFAQGLDLPYGITFWPPPNPRFVYVGESGRILRFPWRPGAATPSGPAQVIVAGLPTGGHWTRDLAASPDGSRIFVAVGSAANVAAGLPPAPPEGLAGWEARHGLGAAWGDEADRAAVLWLPPAGGVLHPYAQGLRNCAGLAVQPGAGTVWCVVNERDGLGDNLPPDYATGLRAGGFYGWPWYYLGAHPEPRLPRRPELATRVTVPDVLLQAHSAPLGIAFYDRAAFPPQWRGAFVALHGSWNRSRRTGYKVVRLPLADGRADGSYQDFLTGFVRAEDSVWGRPVGVAVAADGALLVSEDAGGTIWRIVWRGP
jgi:glucose/arabinose dehydrogenase